MTSVLDEIVATRRHDLPAIGELVKDVSVATLPRSQRSLEDALRTRPGTRPALVMECKHSSPSRGVIVADYDPVRLARAYRPWAAAISVLTEPHRFGGSYDDLAAVSAVVDQPVLCKDFIVDPRQVLAARMHGADAVLLMLSVLDDQTYTHLSGLASRLGMDVLTEVDTPDQMDRATALGARIIGINNRDLRTLQVDLSRAAQMAESAPRGVVLVGESGVNQRSEVEAMAGLVDALLVGSALAGSQDPARTAQDLAGGQPTSGPAGARALARAVQWRPRTGEELGARDTAPRVDPYYGPYGGQFVPQILVPALDQLESAYLDAVADPSFLAQVRAAMRDYLGRPTPVTRCRNLPLEGRAEILLKREDLVHGGAHKGNQVLAQALLARRMGKTRIIAETGAGQHGTATAMVCALLGLECTIYMGAVDVVRQAPNVERMELMGATVVPVATAGATLKGAINEAMRDWSATFQTSHYLLGTAAGPHPFPMMVREFHRLISTEARAQVVEMTGRLPDAVVACVGGGSNAIGSFAEFLDDDEVALVGVEPAGEGLQSGRHGAPIRLGRVGVLHGARSYLMRDADGLVEESHSISAGLDYPGVGPQHAWLHDSGRVTYTAVDDDAAVDALVALSRHEGIIPALESSHALAHALDMARQVGPDDPVPTILVVLSGRGDKDLDQLHDPLTARAEQARADSTNEARATVSAVERAREMVGDLS